MSSSLRILVADENEKIRNGICSDLEVRSGWIVCGRAVGGMDAVQKAVDLKPDVVLVDVSMPGLNGFEAAGCIHEHIPKAEILIVTEHDSRTLEKRLVGLVMINASVHGRSFSWVHRRLSAKVPGPPERPPD